MTEVASLEEEKKIRDRIKLLASEMNANDEENQQMQEEIDTLYARLSHDK